MRFLRTLIDGPGIVFVHPLNIRSDFVEFTMDVLCALILWGLAFSTALGATCELVSAAIRMHKRRSIGTR